jgi:hypothetical protein
MRANHCTGGVPDSGTSINDRLLLELAAIFELEDDDLPLPALRRLAGAATRSFQNGGASYSECLSEAEARFCRQNCCDLPEFLSSCVRQVTGRDTRARFQETDRIITVSVRPSKPDD